MKYFHRYRSLIVPIVSTVLSLLLLIFDLSFEPAITLIASIAASIVIYNQLKSDWTPRTNNLVYRIQIRNPDPQNINSCVNAILDSEPAILKWKLYHHDGEFKDLVIESSEKISAESLSEIAWKHKCKPYWVSLGDKILWETKAI